MNSMVDEQQQITMIEESMCRIRVMRCQEVKGYTKSDYFGSCTTSTSTSSSDRLQLYDIDPNSRTLMVLWCNQIIDYCNFNRETCEIAVSYVDRYLLTTQGSMALYDRSQYQLVCMTAVYTAVKLHEEVAIDPKLVSIMSRGLYSIQEIEQMERNMLTALNWRVNPPTSYAFCRELLNLIPYNLLSATVRDTVSELTQQQLETALKEYSFVGIKASTVAYCSLMNSFEIICDADTVTIIRYVLIKAMGPECCTDLYKRVQSFLYYEVISEVSPALSTISDTQNGIIISMSECSNSTTGTSPSSNTKVAVRGAIIRTHSPQSIAPLKFVL